MSMGSDLWYQNLVVQERARQDLYRRVWEAYFGNMPKPLTIKPGKPDDNVRLNLVRLVVNATVSFLFGKEPKFELDEGRETPAEEWLQGVWRYNRKMQLLQKLATNGAACGHVFLKMQLPAAGQRYPRLINLSPEHVQVITDADDIDMAIRYLIEYKTMGRQREEMTVRQSIERDEAGRWKITDEVSVGNGDWTERQSIWWPWPWAPIIDCQNLPSPNEYYGMADIEEDVLELNHACNFALSNLQRIVRYHAHPRTYGTGFTAKDFNQGADETILLPEGATLANLEMTNDLSSLIELYKRIKEGMHETTATPEIATGKLENTGQLSGVALQIMYQPLLQKTEAKRLTYGEMLIELNRRLLDMAGYGDANLCTITWPDMLPRNDMEERQVALLDKELGVSDDTLLEKLGYDAKAEAAKGEMDGADMAEQLMTAFDRGEA